jgi:hypothetical protein
MQLFFRDAGVTESTDEGRFAARQAGFPGYWGGLANIQEGREIPSRFMR